MSDQADRPFTLYFVRHGVTEANFRGYRCGGDLDIPLMDIGCDQSYLLAKQIERMNLRIGVILAGSLMRARQTASIISGVLRNVPVEIDPLLNERRLGDWNHRSVAETEPLLAAGIDPPGGETEHEFRERIADALQNVRANLDRRPLVVSSKGVGRVLNILLGGQGRMAVGNGEIVEFIVGPGAETSAVKVRRPDQA
jgi:probable phosphoglycerate mutase